MNELERIPQSPEDSLLNQGIIPEALLALALLSPDRETAVSTYLNRVDARRRARTQEFEEEILNCTHYSPEALLHRLLDDEKAAALFEQAVRHAVASSERKKRQGLARAVASGLLSNDEAQVDLAELQVRAIDALETVHIRVLVATVEAPPHERPGEKKKYRRGWVNESSLNKVCPWARSSLNVILAELAARGILVREGTITDALVQVTPFGASLLDILKDRSMDE